MTVQVPLHSAVRRTYSSVAGQVEAALVEACGSAARTGLAQALSFTVLAYGVAAIFFVMAARTIKRDLASATPRDA